MTFEDLIKANDSIKTVVIEKTNRKTGEVSKKDYAEVFQKIKAFRMLYPEGTISTELLSLKDGVAIFKASVSDEAGNLLGTGTAYEKEGSSFINATSYIENCETSAVGRALSMCGIGIDLGVSSYEEVANAMLNQTKDPAPKVEGEVVKKEKKEKKEVIPGYPDKEIMLNVIRKHYPDGSDNLKALLKSAEENSGRKTEKLEDLSETQMAAIYNKFGGR